MANNYSLQEIHNHNEVSVVLIDITSNEIFQGTIVLTMFTVSLIHVVYYYIRTHENLQYVVAFSLALVYQIVFYALRTAYLFDAFTKPYADYFTDLSFKRNLLFAILSTLVSLNLVVQERMVRRNIDEN